MVSELEVPVGMLSWTQRQGDLQGLRVRGALGMDRKAAVIPSQLLGNCKGRGVRCNRHLQRDGSQGLPDVKGSDVGGSGREPG